jgi:beta-aspartyl-peptidase (threonine type)
MYSIAIHGGAGAITRSLMSPDQQKGYEQALDYALRCGSQILANGGAALDAVTEAVVALEDCPLFNAGKGSVFNHEGSHEMDASIMRGDTKAAGAVGAVQLVRNPIKLARLVMEESEHVFMVGKGAETFARLHNLAFEKENYFFDSYRYAQYKEAMANDTIQLDHAQGDGKKFGTVGAVALDEMGNLCAATSTGGMTNKKYGRLGDTPMIGAGTYANNNTCAVSCTGHGEFFIRQVVAHQVHCLMEYKNMSLHDATHKVVMDDLVKIGGEGGLIAVDAQGNIALPFNSEGMYRGFANSKGQHAVMIYRDEA